MLSVKQLKELLRKWPQGKLERQELPEYQHPVQRSRQGEERGQESGGCSGQRLLNRPPVRQPQRLCFGTHFPKQLASKLERSWEASIDIMKSSDSPQHRLELCIPHFTTSFPQFPQETDAGIKCLHAISSAQ